MQKRSLAFKYGDFWFVRAPWKGFRPEKWFSLATGHGESKVASPNEIIWNATIDILRQIDTNGDEEISIEELNNRVREDGIIVLEYDAQISLRERCRAAAMMTVILKFTSEPDHIEAFKLNYKMINQGNEHPLFSFPECDSLY